MTLNFLFILQIQVSLPTNLQIKSNVIVISFSQDGKVINEGQFSYTLTNAVLLRQSKVKADESNLEADIKQKILAYGSSVSRIPRYYFNFIICISLYDFQNTYV